MTSNYLRVVEGLDILDNVLAPFIVRVLREHYGHDWWSRGVLATLAPERRRRFPHGGDTDHLIQWIDPVVCLTVIEHHWRDLFASRLDEHGLAWVRELHAARNTVAHKGPDDVAESFARHVLDLIRRIAAPIEPAAGERILTLMAQTGRVETPL